MKKYFALLNANLEAFMAVAKHKSVHAAARAIHLSQTAMTQRIHSLEHKLETTLFIRARQGMQLTAEGEKLLRYCHTVADFSSETLQQMMSAGIDSIQRITITGPSSIMASRIIPGGMQIMKNFPKLFITFNVDDTDTSIELLRSGLSHFSILKPEQVSQDMVSKPLAAEEYLLICCKKWRHRKLQDILNHERIIDFNAADQTTLNYLKQFNLFQYAKADRLFVNRTDSLTQMLVEGYGYGVLTKEFSQPYLKNGSLIKLNQGKIYKNYLSLAWYLRPEPPQYFSAIINTF